MYSVLLLLYNICLPPLSTYVIYNWNLHISDGPWRRHKKSYPVMCSGSLVLSFLKQHRPSIRPADEEQNRPTSVPLRTAPLQSSHTCSYRSWGRRKQVVNNNIPGHPPWHQQPSYIKHAVVWLPVTNCRCYNIKSKSYLQIGYLITSIKT